MFCRILSIATLAYLTASVIPARAVDTPSPPPPDTQTPPDTQSPPDFASEVRPILSDHCFACHGPDENERHADLRLDTADGIATVVTAGDPGSSELISRITTSDSDLVMPPPEYDKPLSEDQKQILRGWISGGGQFRQHWAFERPSKVELPSNASHPVDFFIDRKLAAKGLTANQAATDERLLRRVCLDLTGLPPTRDQIRRIQQGSLTYESLVDELLASPAFGQHFGRHWLDLVRFADTHGLHLDNYREMWPYRDWVIDAFNDNMPFDQFVTEQLAGDLLPGATLRQQIASGFNRLNVTTNEGGSIYEEVFARNVIDRTDAFGTIFLGMTTQCAVCHDHKFDPISQKDYYSLSAFFNSLDGRAMDGNKKDHEPVVRVPSEADLREFAELDRMAAETREQMQQPIASVDAAQREWERSLAGEDQPTVAEFTETLIPRGVQSKSQADVSLSDDQKIVTGEKVANQDTHVIDLDLPATPSQGDWQTIELQVFPDPKTDRVGVSTNGNAVLTEVVFETRDSADAAWKPLAITSAVADIEQSGGDFAVSFAFDNQRASAAGWAVAGHEQKGERHAWFAIPEVGQRIRDGARQMRVRLEYQSRFAKHQFYAVRFRISNQPPAAKASDPITLSDLHWAGPFHVDREHNAFYMQHASEEHPFDANEVFQHDGETYRWTTRNDWIPVGVHQLPGNKDFIAANVLHQTLESPKAQTIDLLLGTSDGHIVFLNDRRIAESKRVGPIRPLQKTYSLELKQGRNELYIKTVSHQGEAEFAYAYRSAAIPPPRVISKLVARPSDERSENENESLRQYYRQVVCVHPDWLALKDMIRGIESVREKRQKEIPTTLVWKELDEPREAHLLIRGQYDHPGEVVQRRVPEFLPKMGEGTPRDRLGLAHWLTSDKHPLTARVAVNRFWQSLFGTGLVKTSEDFGSQGEPPSHGELLDWLAVDFREHGWDVKRLIRLIVTSDAYRRDASMTAEHLRKDPENRLLARGPRHRLDAEVLRDQALALAGLLNLQAGGPSVKPPQPSGLWYAVGYTNSNTANFKADSEPEKQLRRSVYIFWKRTSAPPQMATLDAPSRESCTARRERTNTPLQALLLMNEHQYLQASKHLAFRVLRECDSDDAAERVAWLLHTVTARSPNPDEVDALVALHDKLRTHYGNDAAAAKDLLSIDAVVAEDAAIDEQAAWMMIASTVLNLDEVVNK